MIEPFGLVVFQRRQVSEGRGLGLVQNGLSHGLQGAPAWPVQVRCMPNLPKQAAPFDYHPVYVAGPEQVGDPAVLVQRVLVDRGNDLFGPSAVLRRHTIFEVAWNGLQAKFLVASQRKTATPAIVL